VLKFWVNFFKKKKNNFYKRILSFFPQIDHHKFNLPGRFSHRDGSGSSAGQGIRLEFYQDSQI